MRQLRNIKYSVLCALWFAEVVYALLLLPPNINSKPQLSIPGADKVAHFVLFAVLTFLLVKALKERSIQVKIPVIFTVLLFFAIATEVIQGYFLEHRTGDLWDLVADMLGVVVVLFLINFKKTKNESTIKRKRSNVGPS